MLKSATYINGSETGGLSHVAIQSISTAHRLAWRSSIYLTVRVIRFVTNYYLPAPVVTPDLQALKSRTKSTSRPEATLNSLTSLIPLCGALDVVSGTSFALPVAIIQLASRLAVF